MAQMISTIAELTAVLSTAVKGGQFVTAYCESPVKLLKTATDNKEPIKAGFAPVKKYAVTFNFGTDYEKKMSAILGTDYHASDANRVHLIKNVLMQYKSTGNVCLIYINANHIKDGVYLNGVKLTDEEEAYMERFKSKAGNNKKYLVEYRTLGVMNLTELHMGGEVYKVNITQTKTLAA